MYDEILDIVSIILLCFELVDVEFLFPPKLCALILVLNSLLWAASIMSLPLMCFKCHSRKNIPSVRY